MKKAKFLLCSVALISIVGAVCAVNITRSLFFGKYCYVITEMHPVLGGCTSTTIFASFRPLLMSEPTVYYTSTLDVNQCIVAECPNIGVPITW